MQIRAGSFESSRASPRSQEEIKSIAGHGEEESTGVYQRLDMRQYKARPGAAGVVSLTFAQCFGTAVCVVSERITLCED